MTSPKAIIYLSDQRGCTQSDWFRSYHTFNFGSYFNENKKAVGDLQAFNDETLKESCTRKFHVKSSTGVLLIPIVGGIEYHISTGISGVLDTGEAHLLIFQEDSELEIKNPFESDLINFLHIWLTISPHPSGIQINESRFDLSNDMNRLMPISHDWNNRMIAHIGKFEGRKDYTYNLKDPHSNLFVFVIEGAFEVQNRLLQMRDGLLLSDVAEVEFEALSNQAIILLVEYTAIYSV